MEPQAITHNDHQKTINQPSSFGYGQIVLGILIIAITTLTAWFSAQLLGIIIVLWGSSELLYALVFKKRVGATWVQHSIIGCAALATGIVIILLPGIGASVISLLLAIFFILGGMYKIIEAAKNKLDNWGLIMSGGGISVLLGLFILSQWPLTNFILLGVLIGFEVILNGWSIIAVSYALRNVTFHHHSPTS